MELAGNDDISLESLRQGDAAALGSLVRAQTGFLLRGAMAMGFREADAEELVQETFVAFLAAVKRFAGQSSLKTFLFGILRNKGLEMLRSRRRETGVDDAEAVFDSRFNAAGHWLAGAPQGPEDAALTQEIAGIIRACAEGLSPDQKAAFFLKEAEGAASDEICNILGVSYTNLRVLLFRARVKLRECLERSWEKR